MNGAWGLHEIRAAMARDRATAARAERRALVRLVAVALLDLAALIVVAAILASEL